MSSSEPVEGRDHLPVATCQLTGGKQSIHSDKYRHGLSMEEAKNMKTIK